MAGSMKALLLAGNGFIGRRVATLLASGGNDVVVHHTGRDTLPEAPGISGVVVDRTPLPIVDFPEKLLSCKADTAVHFNCMGEPDARALLEAFDGRVGRIVLISSCDVYRAYGRFIRTEPGSPDPTPLAESAPLRQQRYPYRTKADDRRQLEYWYDKLEAERVVSAARRSEVTILRLPKVYGPGDENGLQTVYGFAHQPSWRWTHGHVDNIASAIVLGAFHPEAAGETFNLGERHTPTMGERLARLPARPASEAAEGDYDFRQDLHCDTGKLRRVLGYADTVDEVETMAALARNSGRLDHGGR